jgi:hypothetical protein
LRIHRIVRGLTAFEEICIGAAISPGYYGKQGTVPSM